MNSLRLLAHSFSLWFLPETGLIQCYIECVPASEPSVVCSVPRERAQKSGVGI
jgi:hypothetical protein